jgi:hypothetical protein
MPASDASSRLLRRLYAAAAGAEPGVGHSVRYSGGAFCSSFFRHTASDPDVFSFFLSPAGRPPLVSDADEEQDRSVVVACALLWIAIDPVVS